MRRTRMFGDARRVRGMRPLALAAACAMLLACLVALPARAWAAEVDSWDDLVSAVSTASGDVEVEATGTLEANDGVEISGGNVTVSFGADSKIERSDSDTTFTVKSGAVLTIEGSVTVSGGTGSLVKVEAGGTLNVNGAITASNVNGSDSFIDVAGALTMDANGAVKNWQTSNSSGDYSAINVHGQGATFAMNGGEVSGNTLTSSKGNIAGGSIQVLDGASMTMNGGSITKNNLSAGSIHGGGVYVSEASFTMNNGTISENQAGRGAGVCAWREGQDGIGSTVSMISGNVTNNKLITASSMGNGYTMKGGGGGFYVCGGSMTMRGGTISGNSAAQANADNKSHGGGIYVSSLNYSTPMGSWSVPASFEMTGGTVSGNSAVDHGGSATGAGIYLGDVDGAKISNATISGNTTFPVNTDINASGGGIAVDGGSATIDNCDILNNEAQLGGGVYATGDSLTLTNCTITGNEALTGDEDLEKDRMGGGVYSSADEFSMSGCTVSENKADYRAGGVYVNADESSITDSTVSKNSSGYRAGGIYLAGENATMSNVTISDNSAENMAGAMYLNYTGEIVPTNLAVTNNTGSSGGGVAVGSDAVLKLDETSSITGNTASADLGSGSGGGLYLFGTVELNGAEISGNEAKLGGGVYNTGTFTMKSGDITNNKAVGEDEGVGGGAYNTGTFTMEGGRIFDNTAAHGANDFYNYSEEDEGGSGVDIGVDPGWGGNHGMELGSYVDDGISVQADGNHGTFTLIDPKAFNLGVDGWYEDEPDARYASTAEEQRVKYAIKESDTSEQYLTLGDPVFAGTLTLEPQDMVAYTGGDSMDGDNFPEVRYKVSADEKLAEALADEDVELTVLVDNEAVKLSEADAAVGEGTYIIPELGTTFTLESTVTGDDEVAGVYTIGITGTVTATLSDGRAVKVEVKNDPAAKLTVRTVSNAGDVADETGQAGLVAANPVTVGTDATGEQDASIATATVSVGAKFYTNGNVNMGLLGNGEDGAQISLLFDDLLPSVDGTTDDTIAALAAKANIKAENAEFKYLDLINEHDGNAWVSTDSDVTVSWPVPDGVNANEVEFTAYHFQGLHREYGGAGSPDAADQIDKCTVETIACTVVNGRVEFTLEGDAKNGCFSPFALVWAPKGGSNPGGGTNPPVTDDDPDDSLPTKPDTDIDKVLTGRDLAANEFSFVLELVKGDKDGVSATRLTGTNAADGSVTLSGSLTFSEEGTYVFRLSEVAPADDDPDKAGVQSDGVTYDGATYEVTATVIDDGGDRLEVEWSGPASVTFENSYEEPEPEPTPEPEPEPTPEPTPEPVPTPEPAPEPEPSAPEVPDTGEPASLVLLASALGASAIGAAAVIRRRS